MSLDPEQPGQLFGADGHRDTDAPTHTDFGKTGIVRSISLAAI